MGVVKRRHGIVNVMEISLRPLLTSGVMKPFRPRKMPVLAITAVIATAVKLASSIAMGETVAMVR